MKLAIIETAVRTLKLLFFGVLVRCYCVDHIYCAVQIGNVVREVQEMSTTAASLGAWRSDRAGFVFPQDLVSFSSSLSSLILTTLSIFTCLLPFSLNALW